MKEPKKKWLALFLCTALVFSNLAADTGDVQARGKMKVKVKKVWIANVKKKKLTLAPGKKFTLKTKVKVKPNKSKYRKVKYSSSNKKVASVSTKGRISAKKAGKATITVSSKIKKKKKVKIRVTVKASKKPEAEEPDKDTYNGIPDTDPLHPPASDCKGPETKAPAPTEELRPTFDASPVSTGVQVPTATTTGEEPTSPVQGPTATTAAQGPTSLVQEPTATTAGQEPTSPVQEPTATTAAQGPTLPVQEPTATTAAQGPTLPVQKPTATTAAQSPTSPVQKPTATTAGQEPTSPVQKPTATTAGQDPTSPVQKPTATTAALDPTSPVQDPTTAPTSVQSGTPEPAVTSSSMPTATSGVTNAPTTAPIKEEEPLDIGQIVGGGDGLAVDKTTNSVTAANVSNFFIPLPTVIPGGEAAELTIKGEDRSTKGFRVRLAAGTDGSSAASDWTLSKADNISGKFTWNLNITATADARYIEIKGPDYQTNIQDLTISGATVLLEKPAETPQPTKTPQPTETPQITEAPLPTAEFQKLPLSKEMTMGSAALEGEPVYNEDGSMTVTIKNESGGGGVALYLREDKKPIDIDYYSEALLEVSAESDTPLALAYFENGSSFWSEAKDFGFDSVGTEKKTISLALSPRTDMNGIRIRFNSWNLPADAKTTLTIHSVTLVRDLREPDDTTEGYEPLYELAEKYGLKMGTVMNDTMVRDKKYYSVMKYHFNSLTAANEMKGYSMLNEKDSKEKYVDENSMPQINFTNADKIMDYAKENGIKVRGHALVWDADMCDWFFREGYDSTKGYASKEVNDKRMKSYIEQVLTHFEEKYPGVIYCWDTVNEAVGDSEAEYASGDARHVRTKRGEKTNLFYDHVGSDYVERAFLYARQKLDAMGNTDIKLYYNDYSTFFEGKRDAICELIKSINSYQSDGKGGYVRLCDGMGMQSYIGGFGVQNGCMNENDIKLIKTAIMKYADLGVEVQVTELAVRNYQNDEATIAEHGEFYKKLFQTYLSVNEEHVDADGAKDKPLKAISIWGIVDRPNMDETDYSYRMNGTFCGLFDEYLKGKPAFQTVHALLKGN